jgi:hypothetical protein
VGFFFSVDSDIYERRAGAGGRAFGGRNLYRDREATKKTRILNASGLKLDVDGWYSVITSRELL